MRGIEEVGFNLKGSGATFEGLASRFRPLGCHKKLSAQASSGLGVQGLGLRVQGLKFRVLGLGL